MRSRLSLRSLISSTVGGTCRANAHEMILARFLLRPGRRLLEERIHLLQVTVADLGEGLQDSERRRAGQPGEPVTSRASRRGPGARRSGVAPAAHHVEERLRWALSTGRSANEPAATAEAPVAGRVDVLCPPDGEPVWGRLEHLLMLSSAR